MDFLGELSLKSKGSKIQPEIKLISWKLQVKKPQKFCNPTDNVFKHSGLKMEI